jgi:hypothetical protein
MARGEASCGDARASRPGKIKAKEGNTMTAEEKKALAREGIRT